MPPMPGWIAKPAEFWLFDEYFSGPQLQSRLEAVLDGINDDGSDSGHDDQFWAANPKLKKAEAHFLEHWLGQGAVATNGSDGTYFSDLEKNQFMEMLRRAVRKAATFALAEDQPKPLHMNWMCAPDQPFLGVGVTDGPGAVGINIVTPPYDDHFDADEASYRADRAWSLRLNPKGVIEGGDKNTSVLKDMLEDMGSRYGQPHPSSPPTNS